MAPLFVIALAAIGGGVANGAIINFDTVVNGTANLERTTPLTTQGFTFTSNHFHVNDVPAACLFGGCTTLNGTQYLAVDGPQLGFPVVVTPVGGGVFSVVSIQASRLFVDGVSAALSNFANADTLVLTGALNGGGTVSVAISLPTLPAFNTFALPSTFANLVSLTIAGSVAGLTDNASWAIDNLEVSVIPEPAGAALAALGLALLFGLRKHHK